MAKKKTKEILDAIIPTSSDTVDEVDGGGWPAEPPVTPGSDDEATDLLGELYDGAYELLRDALSGKKEVSSSRLSAAKFLITQQEGRAGTKTVEQAASTIVVKCAIPGHDEEINRYLATLSDEVLAKFDYDDETLTKVKGFRTP